MMSCPIGDGAACAIVGRADLAKKLQPGPAGRARRRVAPAERDATSAATSSWARSSVRRDDRRHRRRPSTSEAGLGPEDLDLVQVHDAFAIEELEYYELLGLCGEGEAEACIERGDFELGGRVPVSTDGGLIARGHPGGPTGLAQIWETTLQLRGEAGKRQVDERARRPLPHDGRRQRVRDPHPAARLRFFGDHQIT